MGLESWLCLGSSTEHWAQLCAGRKFSLCLQLKACVCAAAVVCHKHLVQLVFCVVGAEVFFLEFSIVGVAVYSQLSMLTYTSCLVGVHEGNYEWEWHLYSSIPLVPATWL